DADAGYAAFGGGGGGDSRVDRTGCCLGGRSGGGWWKGGTVVVTAPESAAGSTGKLALGTQRNRCLRGGEAGGKEADSFGGGGCGPLDPPAHHRYAPAATSVGGRSEGSG